MPKPTDQYGTLIIGAVGEFLGRLCHLCTCPPVWNVVQRGFFTIVISRNKKVWRNIHTIVALHIVNLMVMVGSSKQYQLDEMSVPIKAVLLYVL